MGLGAPDTAEWQRDKARAVLRQLGLVDLCSLGPWAAERGQVRALGQEPLPEVLQRPGSGFSKGAGSAWGPTETLSSGLPALLMPSAVQAGTPGGGGWWQWCWWGAHRGGRGRRQGPSMTPQGLLAAHSPSW